MSTTFAITFDYLCPFARNANEHVVVGLQDGADWDVSFVPYSLSQGHVAEGEPDVWDTPDPSAVPGILALQVGLAIRDHYPEQFLDAHLGLFAARHDHGEDLRNADVLRRVVEGVGIDADTVFEHVRNGDPLETLRKEHEAAVSEYDVWGVPTFLAGGRGVFVRLLDRPEGDGAKARDRIQRVVDLVVGFPELHEFKQADLPV